MNEFMAENPLKVLKITPFPQGRAVHSAQRGTASYSKNLVLALCRQGTVVEVTILANKLKCDSSVVVERDEINNAVKEKGTAGSGKYQIIRCWREGGIGFLKILLAVWRRRAEVDVIHLQHEYGQFGRKTAFLLFPFFLAALKLLRKPIVVTLHGLVTGKDITKPFREQHFLNKYSSLMSFYFDFTNKCIPRLAAAVIVHWEAHKAALMDEYHIPGQKIAVIPHGIEIRQDAIPQDTAKKVLKTEGRRTLLFWGYLAGYKGLEVLIEAFRLLAGSGYKLIIAGGEHKHLRWNRRYRRFIDDCIEKAGSISGEITFTGFVPEEKIPLYFCAADLVIFPYPEMHACSGPFSLALAYQCDFIVSQAFASFYGLPSEASFEYDAVSLSRAINKFFQSEEISHTLKSWRHKYTGIWHWDNAAECTLKLYKEIL